jgi:hypothetical protein
MNKVEIQIPISSHLGQLISKVLLVDSELKPFESFKEIEFKNNFLVMYYSSSIDVL